MARTRQLAAIMFSGIDGYAALIQQDEKKAVELNELHHDVFYSIAGKYLAKNLQNIGHESLCLFSSALEAVECAIELQHAFRNEPVVPVKIGIHLGDIIYSEEEAIGEGIDVARRIKSQALPGGILISNKIYEEVKNQPGIETGFLKACELEEGGRQVEIYAITNEGIVSPELPREGRPLPGEGRGSKSRLRYFWDEAKRRNVVRVVSYYAAGAYVTLELSSILSDSLKLPDWVMTVIIILLVTLFIVLAVVSWIYDITPEGIKKTAPIGEGRGSDISVALEDDESIPGMPGRRSWFARHRVLRRYLVPVLVVGLLTVFYLSKDRIFQNWERVNKEAKAHTDSANLFVRNNAPTEMVKQELDMALEADPEYAPALHTYAMVHLAEGDSALAKQKLHQIVESNPGFSMAWNLLANFAFWQDSMELAMRYSTNALETGPTNSTAAYNLAILSEDKGLHSQAEVWYQKAIELDSAFTSAYSALGAFYNHLGRPTEAGMVLRKTLRISPASPHNYRVYKNLAESHFILQEYVSAFEYLEKSKALEPDYPETERCFALYYEARGYLQESIPHWRRYLALETDSLEQLKAQSHLDSLRAITP
ncbi:MAG: hypothetical protein E4H10_03975 [Bacteroidia bacterium]|nr:MAG: hypothetical protein E4H10_03975 [Bacteroidia bacterium]